MKWKIFLTVGLLMLTSGLSAIDECRIIFWNLENLFLPGNDSLTEDDEFTPLGERHWTWERYRKKINLVWKTLYSATPGGPPEIIALGEVENRKVIEDIFKRSPLNQFSYRILHQDSPDPRGIDLAIAYRADRVRLIDSSFIEIDFPELSGRQTRDIVYARFCIGTDSLDLFVNHWPSKYGGSGYTDILRVRCAGILLEKIFRLSGRVGEKALVCCGDFNDTRESRALNHLLEMSGNGPGGLRLVETRSDRVRGTLKYQGKWEQIDHFFINNKLAENAGSGLKFESALILEYEWLLTGDEVYGGFKPFRTYNGFSYAGGISDHLPVMLVISFDRR